MKKTRWEILYEDDALLVIDKPAGWLSIPDRYDQDIDNVYTSLASYRDNIFVVHRLDRFTSGVMLFAKTEEAHSQLNLDFENQKIEKKYLAFVSGTPANKEGIIDAPIAKSNQRDGSVKIQASGKESITEYKMIKEWAGYTQLACYPKTGRLHQIRIHLQHIGHSLMVDPRYSSNKSFYVSSVKRKKYNLKKEEEERPLIKRQTLHAASITFKHPVTGAKKEFSSPLPKDLRALEKQLDKWCKKD